MVYETACAVQIPLIGMGGIQSADDAIEFMLAGASAVAIGTGSFIDPFTTLRVIEGIDRYCADRSVGNVVDIIGAVRGQNHE
jgi:dihydroorotate dehydrogenase (NAD+) catalytic subunit